MIAIQFDNDKDLIGQIKKLKGVRWSKGKKYWYFPAVNDWKTLLHQTFGESIDFQYKEIQKIYEKNGNAEKEDISGESFKEGKNIIDIKHNIKDHLLYIKAHYVQKDEIKKLSGARWHSISMLWVTNGDENNIERLKKLLKILTLN